MIDLHTHILPHIDDGAKDTAMAVAMLKSEIAQGVDTVVLTSHYYGRKRSPQQFLEKRGQMFAHLKGQIPQGISLRLGAEVHFTGINMPPFDDLCMLAIQGTKYILLELPFTEKWTKSLLDEIADFISETGYTPIIAHVERYREVQKKPSIASELVQIGCLLQVNTYSFFDKREKKLAYALVKHGLAHCIGTDTHDMSMRAPNMERAKKRLQKAGYSTWWEGAQENMEKVLRGEQVRVERAKPIKKFFGKYL